MICVMVDGRPERMKTPRMLCFAVLSLILAPWSGAAQELSAGRARFEPSPCVVAVSADERIDCGVLVVPENRDKADSRLIRLPVVIFRSRAITPAPDPVVFVTGGPGGSNVAGKRSGKQIPFLDLRDYVVLEPRGARYAQPALECPATNELHRETAAGRLGGAERQAALARAAAACRQTLVSSGVDLDGYTTAASADDLEDLRLALGYPAWNLHGVSYGTRVVLTALRRHPKGVRSVVLDSVLPPEVDFDEVSAANLQRSLDLVFDACAVDRECGRAFPNVRGEFAALVARADRAPLPLDLRGADAGAKPVHVRGAQVVDAIYAALHDPQSIPAIPGIVHAAASGDYASLARLVKANQGPSSFAWGLRYSIWCADEAPFEDAARVASQTSPALGLGGIDEGAATPEVCRAWDVRPAPRVESQPVASSVPALIFAGEFDPDTPPQWGRQLLAGLSKAFYVEMRGQSHGAAFNRCGVEIMTVFLRDPAAPPPVGCALSARGADFGRK
jgi:pimeloyl-ACP methyl ester carboxylesterase